MANGPNIFQLLLVYSLTYLCGFGSVPGSFVVAHDGHVAQCGDEHQRVDRDVGNDVIVRTDGDVGDDVDDVVHQATDEVAERPVGGGELVGGHRRNDTHEDQVTHGNVQQQQVGVSRRPDSTTPVSP